ncbi:MAG: ATP-binding protein [Bacteroidetes bacterium]|nr:ATP-binding protein [Bacteroidota bacterium]
MIRQEEIARVIDAQYKALIAGDSGLLRDALSDIPVVSSFATIITGLRRCGKSTLLLQLLRRDYSNVLYLNFDDIRLSGFEAADFVRLHKEIADRNMTVLFFDEIQVVPGWEKYINQLLREGYAVFITGSNATMLSTELGTHLTGRHLSMELFPFSYSEFIRLKGLRNEENAVKLYLEKGGIPDYVETGIPLILSTLVDDILLRDIAVRHSIRDVASLRQLTVFLISNIGNLIAANKLTGMFGIKSPATLLEYFSFLKNTYLLDFVPIFSHSIKVQIRNPKKLYVMDMGLYTENTMAMTTNWGRRLENLIFLHLRRKYKQIFYYKGEDECDFLTMEKNSIKEALQVCWEINDENFEREYNGLTEAMRQVGLSEGSIITLKQQDVFQKDGMTVRMIPAHLFLES